MKVRSNHTSSGFALIAVTVIIAGLIILVTSVLFLSGVDRKSSRAQSESYRAELAAEAGVEEAMGILLEAGMTDEFFIMEAAHQLDVDGTPTPVPYTYLALPPDESSSSDYRYVPLFSGAGASSGPLDSERTLGLPTNPPIPDDEDDLARFRPRPYLPEVSLAWRELRNKEGRAVARYAYWIEDRQRYLNTTEAGNLLGPSGTHERNGEVPGIPLIEPNQSADGITALNQIALFSLDESGPSEDTPEIDIDNRLINDRDWLNQEGSSALAVLEIPLDGPRDTTGSLLNTQASLIEENLDLGLISYLEQPIIPYTDSIDPAKRGTPKLNLNEVLQGSDRGSQIELLSQHIDEALPDFGSIRQGGFGDSYVKTIAANALDYADSDSQPTLSESVVPEKENLVFPEYRGLDAYPVVSEHLIEFEFPDLSETNGQYVATLNVSMYVELWNHTNLDIEGEYEISYETGTTATVGSSPGVSLMDPDVLDSANTEHDLRKLNGHYFFPPLQISMGPNEYRYLHVGTVSYTLNAGPAGGPFAEPGGRIAFSSDDQTSRFFALWDGRLIDGLRREMHRQITSVRLKRRTVRMINTGHSYGEFGNFQNNMGDSRQSYYIDAHASRYAYPNHLTPGFRNARVGSSPTPTTVHLRVNPSEWPDGGHDSMTIPSRLASSSTIDPNSARFIDAASPAPDPAYSPTFLSNRGRFLSASELGNIFDPVMWDQGQSNNNPAAFAEIDQDSVASPRHGGGNSLRIGRREHPKFDRPGARASDLLDLFHAGDPLQQGDSGALAPAVRIAALPNLNTASEETIRLLVAGELVTDSLIANKGDWDFDNHAPSPEPTELSPPTQSKNADTVAKALVASRPFASWSEVARARDENGEFVFGNKFIYPNGETLMWNDRAAEETFARLYNTATLRSRNFRIHVIAEALDVDGDTSARFERSVNCFVDPGERSSEGQVQAAEVKTRILNEVPR